MVGAAGQSRRGPAPGVGLLVGPRAGTPAAELAARVSPEGAPSLHGPRASQPARGWFPVCLTRPAQACGSPHTPLSFQLSQQIS